MQHPWSALIDRPPAEAIGEIFAPLADRCPHLIAALQSTCVRLEAEQDRAGRWRLLYHLRRDIPESEWSWKPAETTMMGGAPSASQPLDGVPLPPDLADFYAVHDGFGAHQPDFGVETLYPARQLEFPFTDRADWLSYHCDSGGHLQLLVPDPLDPTAPRRSVDWDRETGELGAPRTAMEFIDRNLALTILGAETLPERPRAPATRPCDWILVDWGDLPAGPMAGAAIMGTVYRNFLKLRHPGQDVATVRQRWMEALNTWTIEVATDQALRVTRRWRELHIHIEPTPEGATVSFQQLTLQRHLPDAWAARGLPLAEGRLRTTHSDPVPHLQLSYPGVSADTVAAQWRQLPDWAASDDGGCLLLTRGEETLRVRLWQVPLGTEAIVYVDASALPPLWSFIAPLRTGPLTDSGQYSGAECLSQLWFCSRDATLTSAAAARVELQRYCDHLTASGWHLLQQARESIGPNAWLTGQDRWLSMVVTHSDYDCSVHFSLWHGQPIREWQGITLPTAGWVMGADDDRLQLGFPWHTDASGSDGLPVSLREDVGPLEAWWAAELIAQGFTVKDDVAVRGELRLEVSWEDHEDYGAVEMTRA